MACRQCYQCSIWERLYLVVTMLGLLLGIGFALYGLFKDKVQTSDSSYLFIFIINSVFALIYAVKGIKYHDPYDLAILVLSVAPPVIYLIINIIIVNKTEVKLARLILGIIFALFISGGGFQLVYHFCKTKKFMEYYGIESDSASTISRYNVSNSDQDDLRRGIRTMLLYFFLLSVNLQIDLSASVFTLTSGFAFELKSGTVLHLDMFFVFGPIVVIAAAAFLTGYFAVKKERKFLVIIFAIFSVVLVGAGLYLMVMSIEDLHKPDRDYKLSVVATFASTLMIFLRLLTCIGCYLACQNFGTVSVRRVYQTLPEHNPLLGSTQVERSMYGGIDSGRQ